MSIGAHSHELGESDRACLLHLLRHGQPDGVHCSAAVLEHLLAQGLLVRTEESRLPGFAQHARYELTREGRRIVAP